VKITFLGNHSVPYSSESHHAQTLEQMGHQVVRLQEGCDGNQILTEARNADLFVWVHSHGAQPSHTLPITRVLASLRGDIPMISYHLDLYKGIPGRFEEYRDHPYMTGLDHFFTVDPPLADWLNTHTATKAHYLTPGVLKEECFLADPINVGYELHYPIIFVGSYHYHKEWPYRKQLIDWLTDTYPGFQGFGPNFGKVIRGYELNQLYASSDVVVGDSFSPNFDYPGYWSDRIPETLGRGGFLIHPRIKGIEDFYQDRTHLVLYTYGDFAELADLIDYYLIHHDEREAIRLAGHEHVKTNHTFTNRWNTILETTFR
jgi:hypothetical protein